MRMGSTDVLYGTTTNGALNFLNNIYMKNWHYVIDNIRAATCDFQQCGILTSVDSEKPVQPPFKFKQLKIMFSQ